jgi:hypothetical protein
MTYTAEYANLLRQLHEEEESFGGGSQAYLVAQLIQLLGVESVFDYGAGKRRLQRRLQQEFGLNIVYAAFDPAYPEYGQPKTADLVCCIEVLEHVEPEQIKQVLDDLQKITTQFGFFTVHTSNSGKFLADGRNAHILQRPISWWLAEFSSRFEIQWLNKTGPDSFAVLVTPRETAVLRPGPLELTQTDSFKLHFQTFFKRTMQEFARRIRRRRWRPS